MTDNLITFPQLRASRAPRKFPLYGGHVIPLIEFKTARAREEHIREVAKGLTTATRRNVTTRILVSTDRGEFVSLFHVGQMVAEKNRNYFGKVTGVFLETEGWWHGKQIQPYFIYRVDFYGVQLAFHEGDLRPAKEGETLPGVLGADWFERDPPRPGA